MIIAVPTMNLWENNPIYENIIKFSDRKENFMFFVRPYQVSQYQSHMPDIKVIPIGEECVNMGTTRRWINEYMTRCGVEYYAQIDDRISSIDTVYFDQGKAKVSNKAFSRNNIDSILYWISLLCGSLFSHYPNLSMLSLRRRGFANNVKEDCAVELNGSISSIDDVLIINTKHPLENLPETDNFFEDMNYPIASMSHGRYVGLIHMFTKSADESIPSRCFASKKEKDECIMSTLKDIIYEKYRCKDWLVIDWNKDGSFPVVKMNYKNSPVPRLKLSFKEIERIIDEHNN